MDVHCLIFGARVLCFGFFFVRSDMFACRFKESRRAARKHQFWIAHARSSVHAAFRGLDVCQVVEKDNGIVHVRSRFRRGELGYSRIYARYGRQLQQDRGSMSEEDFTSNEELLETMWNSMTERDTAGSSVATQTWSQRK